MTDAKNPSALTRAILLATLSFAGGVLNGLLGTGGGMILLFALGYLLSAEHAKDAFVISSVGVLAFSAVSAVMYGTGGSYDLAVLPRFALSAAVGGVAGAFLFRYVPTKWLKRLFAALTLYAGLRMLGVFG
ncbi:MAG: sulfite exporter TauE/SafE family protein [Clostridia bacterium]|nr:sulfite exporter TauE/SafE family protein [Clostridia bacterium]